MADSILEKWDKLKLTDAEQAEVLIDLSADGIAFRRGTLCLLGLVVADKVVNKEAFKATMVQIWKIRGGVQFKGVGTNLFLIEFQNSSDIAKVKLGRPWQFDRNLICLEDYNGLIAPGEMVFDKEPMWVQMHNIPLGGMTRRVGRNIGELVGEVLEVDVDKEGVGWGPYLRVNISVNITKPLMRGVVSSFNGNRVWIPFKYERLPFFCFSCGIIKHGAAGCEKMTQMRSMHGNEEFQYGAWLRASYQKHPNRDVPGGLAGEGGNPVSNAGRKGDDEDVA
ncbi:uncharacterized protein LOC122301685 [Carya illinoinensis]|uniref:uncharacterized protein LOC122301685 n=1 Tax=Carya illinoinensis TaxID=32201 RepID=UPI001C71E19F|nr:uncharacterized protein LOC122301685 [Carya illinoinensis]